MNGRGPDASCEAWAERKRGVVPCDKDTACPALPVSATEKIRDGGVFEPRLVLRFAVYVVRLQRKLQTFDSRSHIEERLRLVETCMTFLVSGFRQGTDQ